ncbi:hypothetical protein [Burkholderia pseudomallei]|uniref:hypothetical protein n=1 Tax=Burkholderia pseudomallei TaxID=28450 RepID=UPI001F1A664A|nr:hypothetical protein [Burkholderia pseudomallei]
MIDASVGTVRAVCCSRARRSVFVRSIAVDAASPLSDLGVDSAHPALRTASVTAVPAHERKNQREAETAVCTARHAPGARREGLR